MVVLLLIRNGETYLKRKLHLFLGETAGCPEKFICCLWSATVKHKKVEMFILSLWVYISNHTSFSVKNIFYFIQELKLLQKPTIYR